MSKKRKKSESSSLPQQVYRATSEKPISKAYSILDNDLARDNLENDIPAADLQDL